MRLTVMKRDTADILSFTPQVPQMSFEKLSQRNKQVYIYLLINIYDTISAAVINYINVKNMDTIWVEHMQNIL